MRYTDPELRERLAAEYVLGTMPIRARRRFARLIAAEPELARLVAEWSARFAPLDAATPPEVPPARVWRAIEQSLPAAGRLPAPAPPVPQGWLGRLAFWRGVALATSGALAAALIYIWIGISPPVPVVAAVLSDSAGEPFWIALEAPASGAVTLLAVRPVPTDQDHAFELWGIAAGGTPRSLGVLPPDRDGRLVLSRAALPPAGGKLAVTREPPGGSPTGLPSGPVLWQGTLLAAR